MSEGKKSWNICSDGCRTRSHFLRHTGKLLPDPDREAARRLAGLGLLVLVILLVNIVVINFLHLRGALPHELPLALTHAIIGVLALISVGVVFLARSERLRPQQMLDLGLVYEVVIAGIGGIGFQFIVGGSWIPQHGVSEICIFILLFPVIVPNVAWKTFVASFLAASMDPLGLVLAGSEGMDLSPADFLHAYYWNYICVFLALIPARIVHSMGREVNRARDMGSYSLGDLLGRGGMGEVYCASHSMLAREAAVKLIRPESLGDSNMAKRAIQRFQREAMATAALHSPHTIRLYDFGTTDDGAFYYVMELLDGFDCDTLVRRFGPQTPGRTIHLLRQVCHSLWDAHRSELIHRDIKPANMFVCRYGHELDYVKVLDFGLVKETSRLAEGEAPLTMADSLTGTPAFMAPEMLLDQSDVDGRSDLYALGCVGYWLLTGKLVFDVDTPVRMLAAHLQETPLPPSERTEINIPAGLDEIILSCLKKKPEDRPKNAAELDRLLEQCEGVERWSDECADEWWRVNAPAGALPRKSGPADESTKTVPQH